MKKIKLGRSSHVALVDDEDVERLGKLKWCAVVRSNTVYASNGYTYMHRKIFRPPDGMEVDHINGNGLDNRRANLRVCTHQENSANKRKHRGKAFKGVRWMAIRGKWRSVVTANGKTHHVGLFASEVEAAKAYDAAAKQYFGEFARLNFPKEKVINELPSL